MDHLDKSISNTAMHVSNKSKTWFRDIFKQIQTHYAFKDIFVVLIIFYSNILYFANNFIGSPNVRARPFSKRDIA